MSEHEATGRSVNTERWNAIVAFINLRITLFILSLHPLFMAALSQVQSCLGVDQTIARIVENSFPSGKISFPADHDRGKELSASDCSSAAFTILTNSSVSKGF